MPNEIAIIGDRLFTDVVLANMNGCVSILVKPLDTTQESIGIRLMRFVESRYNSKETIPHPMLGDMN
jgi:predicted HAD superfamily phosphohydrolase YqeG